MDDPHSAPPIGRHTVVATQFIKSQRGQISVEIVLIIALTVAIFLGVSSIFREKQYFAQILSKPWTNISSMIQNGVWQSKYVHPAHQTRWISVKGDDAP